VVLGPSLVAGTNADGGFYIPNLPAGVYDLTFRHGRTAALGYAPAVIRVAVRPETQSVVALAIPAAAAETLTRADVDAVAFLLRDIGVPVDDSVQTRIVAAGASELFGMVVDAGSGRPIDGALVAFEDAGRTIVTEGNGRFAVRELPPRTYRVTVSMLGYETRVEEVEIAPGQRFDMRIALATQPIALKPITVEARARELDRVGFYDRRIDPGTWGTFFTAADIERRVISQVADLLHGVAGAKVHYLGVGRRIVTFNRVTGSGRGCVPPVYLDGMALPEGIDALSPGAIAGVEIYVGTRTPIEYAAMNTCGAIVVWTKRGG
jgi:hypothetical protein